MEVILRQAVENLGKPGDVVKVSNGYARNHLLPRGIAYEATPGNLKRIAQEKSRLEAAENERRNTAQSLAERLEQVSLTFSARVGEEG
jgi:large subunit ribosomal protein L9